MFLHYVQEKTVETEVAQKIAIEGEIHLEGINPRLIKFLENLTPYGPGNVRPKFAVKQAEIVGTPQAVEKGNHLKFKIRKGDLVFDWF